MGNGRKAAEAKDGFLTWFSSWLRFVRPACGPALCFWHVQWINPTSVKMWHAANDVMKNK
jgi:hypothetical protein